MGSSSETTEHGERLELYVLHQEHSSFQVQFAGLMLLCNVDTEQEWSLTDSALRTPSRNHQPTSTPTLPAYFERQAHREVDP